MSLFTYFALKLQQSAYGRFYLRAQEMLDNNEKMLSFMPDHVCLLQRQSLILLLGLLGYLWCKEKIFLFVFLATFLHLRPLLVLRRNEKALSRSMHHAFPLYISNLIIFLEAGYPMETALRHSATMGNKNHLKTLFLEAFQAIDNGEKREVAWQNIVRRAKDPYVSKLIFVAEQGMRIGKRQVMGSLTMLSAQCWKEQLDDMQKDSARASAKMVFPMMIMFFAVAILAMAPGLITLFSAF